MFCVSQIKLSDKKVIYLYVELTVCSLYLNIIIIICCKCFCCTFWILDRILVLHLLVPDTFMIRPKQTRELHTYSVDTRYHNTAIRSILDDRGGRKYTGIIMMLQFIHR